MPNKYSSLLKAYNYDGAIDEEKVNEIVVYYMDNAKAGEDAYCSDLFLKKAQMAFITALIYYVLENDDIPIKEKNFSTILKKVQMAMDYEENYPLSREMNEWFKKMKDEDKQSLAEAYYCSFCIAPPRTRQTIIVNTAIDLQMLTKGQGDTMIYYGTNKTDNTTIMCDRMDFTKPQHRAIFGTTGSGKGVLMKSEIIQLLKNTNDTVYVLDLEGDYIRLAEQLGECIIHITKNSADCINPISIPDACSKASGLVVLDIPQMLSEKEFEIAIYMCLAAIWEKIETSSRIFDFADKHFWIYIDNIMPVLKYSSCEEIFFNIIIGGRPYGCALTYGTQSFSDFYNDTQYGWQTLNQTRLITFLDLNQKDRDLLSRLQNLSFEELSCITEQPSGNGLFMMDNDKIPFRYDQNAFLDDEDASYSYPEEIEYMGKTYILATTTTEKS